MNASIISMLASVMELQVVNLQDAKPHMRVTINATFAELKDGSRRTVTQQKENVPDYTISKIRRAASLGETNMMFNPEQDRFNNKD